MAIRGKRLAATVIGGVFVAAVSLVFLRGAASDNLPAAVAHRGHLTITLTESGVLRAQAATVYRSPVEGHELEITYLAPEGAQVQADDVLVRLDASALRIELERAQQALRQAEIDVEAAEVSRREAEFALQGATAGNGVIAVEEARTAVRLAEAKAARLREEHAALQPLFAKGYITRAELERSATDLDEASAAAELARHKLQVLVERTQPAEQQTAQLQLARRAAEVEHLRPKVAQARAYADMVAAQVDGCTIVARTPGLVIHQDNLFVTPRRKVRVGDRVTPSQGIVTLPDLRHMEVASSIRESDVHLVAPGERALVRVDAFPNAVLTGLVTRVGTLTRSGDGSKPDERRFEIAIRLDPTAAGIRPDMSARVDIAAAERPDALLVPATALFMRDGSPICFVLRDGQVERRLVQVGGSNESDVEIVAGLRPGERVALTDPDARR